jgi:hypothetical protein
MYVHMLNLLYIQMLHTLVHMLVTYIGALIFFYFFLSATPCASPTPPQPSIFSNYSFWVHHLVNRDDPQLLAHAMASDFSVVDSYAVCYISCMYATYVVCYIGMNASYVVCMLHLYVCYICMFHMLCATWYVCLICFMFHVLYVTNMQFDKPAMV